MIERSDGNDSNGEKSLIAEERKITPKTYNDLINLSSDQADDESYDPEKALSSSLSLRRNDHNTNELPTDSVPTKDEPTKPHTHYEDICLVGFCWTVIIAGFATNIIDWVILELYHSLFGISVIIVITSLFFLICYSYLRVLFTNPGFVPIGYVPDNLSKEEIETAKQECNDFLELKKKNRRALADPFAQVRYCSKCKAFKPPRAHHCKDCNRCVLRMDHHCPWMNNCVGLRNHKFFVNFLLFAVLGLLLVTIFHGISIVTILSNVSQKPSRGELQPKKMMTPARTACVLTLVIDEMFCFPFTLMVLSLFGSQLYTIKQNKTTLEDMHCYRIQREARRKGVKFHFPYDLGTLHNIRAFFGPRVLFWCLPIHSGQSQSGGFSFDTNKEKGEV